MKATRALQQKVEELQAAQERLDRVLGSSGAVLYELRLSPEGPVLEWISQNVTAILGYDLADLQAPGWWSDTVHPDDRPRLGSRPEVSAYRDGSNEYRLRHKNGRYRWLREEQRLISATDREPPKVVGVWLDITEQRQLEERLRQAQKMEAMGTLAGGVAHDFNNMLTVVSGCGRLLLDATGLASPLRGEIEEILKATERAAGLTQQLLAFSRGRVMERCVVDLGDIIRGTQSMLGRLIGEDINLVVQLHSGPVRVLGDPGQLTQVLMNLAINARDAMPSGGDLSIKTSFVTLSQLSAEQHGLRGGSHAVLTVSDTGIGMDGATLSRIFEPFFTTKPEGQGTGLGLSTVFGIVKQMGGSISVMSEPGQGATFKVYLARVEGTNDPVIPDQSRSASPRARQATVLLVEDDAVVRRVTRTILERRGYSVVEASNGANALELLADKPIDVVVSDTIMPEMGGRELAGRLAVKRPELPVILTSGYATEASQGTGPASNLFLFLGKPYTADALDAAVQRALGLAGRSR